MNYDWWRSDPKCDNGGAEWNVDDEKRPLTVQEQRLVGAQAGNNA